MPHLEHGWILIVVVIGLVILGGPPLLGFDIVYVCLRATSDKRAGREPNSYLTNYGQNAYLWTF